MVASICILIFLLIITVSYSIFLKFQLRSMNTQLLKRFSENTRQPITLELLDKDLNTLTVNINRCLKAEENLRLKTIREEKLLKQMIANISHDLRTPLTAIKGYQQLMLKEPLSEKQSERLLVAQTHANNLEHLVSQFFQYSYLLDADLKANMESFDLSRLLIETLAQSISLIESKGLNLIIDEFPPYKIMADKDMTLRIIQNLLRNCVAHSDGDIKIDITSSEYIRLSFINPISDPSSIDISHIFQRFYSSDKSRSKGGGLGLSIVKLLSENMDGGVGAEIQGSDIHIWVDFLPDN